MSEYTIQHERLVFAVCAGLAAGMWFARVPAGICVFFCLGALRP